MKLETIVLAGGCFWCTEAVFQLLKGVESVEPGYAGGTTANPSYYNHGDQAEAVAIEYDPGELKLTDILAVFFATHDPTSLNRQGADVGTQYRSGVYYTTDEQKNVVETFIEQLNQSSVDGEPIVTEVKLLDRFYPAEEEHRNFYGRNPRSGYCQVVINPKLQKVKEKFVTLLAEGGKNV